MLPETIGRQPIMVRARRTIPVPTWLMKASIRVWTRFRFTGRSSPHTAPVR